MTLSACVATLRENHARSWLSQLGHKECKPRQAAADLKQVSPGKQRKLKSYQQPGFLESSQREAPIRTPGVLLERGDQSPGGVGRQEAPYWKQSFEAVGRQVQVMLRGSRSSGS